MHSILVLFQANQENYLDIANQEIYLDIANQIKNIMPDASRIER